jgi:hypothetical protein
VRYTEATTDAGPMRIIVDRGNGFFQVGPSAKGDYQNFFRSALRKEAKERGFCLTAAGAPEKVVHWVRFTDIRVVKKSGDSFVRASAAGLRETPNSE